MKLIICVFIMLISAKECDQKKAQLASENISEEMTTDMSKRQMQDTMKINYRAATRGFYLQIWVEGDSIKYTSDNNLKDISTHLIPTEEKEALLKLLSDFDEKSLPELQAPSTRHQFDGAAIATLEIINGEDSYKTVAFDHGNSPKPIALIIDKMLSIKSMFEKQ